MVLVSGAETVFGMRPIIGLLRCSRVENLRCSRSTPNFVHWGAVSTRERDNWSPFLHGVRCFSVEYFQGPAFAIAIAIAITLDLGCATSGASHVRRRRHGRGARHGSCSDSLRLAARRSSRLPLRRFHQVLQTLARSFLLVLAFMPGLDPVQSDFAAGKCTARATINREWISLC